MLSGSAKTSGHRLTRFKNNKAFERLNAFSRKTIHIPNNKTSLSDFSKYDQLKNEHNPTLIIFTKLSAVIISLFIVGLALCFVLDSINNTRANAVIRAEFKINQKIEDYNILTSGGYAYLKQKRYNLAQDEFILALNLNEYGELANKGLLQVLIKQCQLEDQFCNDLQLKKEFNLKSNFVTTDELDFWYSNE